MGDSLNDDIELVRSFSLCESAERFCLQPPAHNRSVGMKGTSSTLFAKYGGTIVDPAELGDDFFTTPAESANANDSSETSIAEGSESQPSTKCLERISLLESEVKLLRAQNAQLLVNSSVLYNTLVQHIEELRAALRERDANPEHPS